VYTSSAVLQLVILGLFGYGQKGVQSVLTPKPKPIKQGAYKQAKVMTVTWALWIGKRKQG
jgi:hypothetical protein